MRIKVLQWNVWFEENIEKVASYLLKNNADIVCLQELTKGYIKQLHANTWEYLAHELGCYAHVQEVPIITHSGQWTQANAILSKFPIVYTSGIWLHEPESGDEYDEQYRSYIEAHVNIDGEVVEVGTTHMSHVHQTSVTPQKTREVSRLTDILDTKRDRYILTGDLNATPESYTVTEIRKRLQHAGPDFEQKTWSTKPHAYLGSDQPSLAWRYDYVFATSDLTVRAAEVLETSISDHLPVCVTFDMGEHA